MLKIGITGNIGSGKSVVSKIFAQLGIPVYNADDAAKKLLDTDKKLVDQLKKEFGENLFENNKLKRKELASIVFKNKDALTKLNGLVHPAVKKHFEKWVESNEDATYIIKEAAILFEAGADKPLDYVIVVTAPEEIRIRRVVKRDNVTEDFVKSIARNQMKEEEKRKKADFVIINDDEHLLIPQVLELNERFLSMAEK
jgi:dephospho-CoA kinase